MALPVAEFLALEHGTEYWGAASHVGKVDDEVLAAPPLSTLYSMPFTSMASRQS
jgi:hypothetical protein